MPVDAPGPAQGGPRGKAALAFAICAAFASWNVVAAPFGLVVGLAAAFLAVRALRRPGASRALATAALVVALSAAVVSAVVVGRTAGAVGTDLPGEPVVKGRTQAELDQVLSASAERTRARRERAARELEGTAGGPRDGGTGRSAGGRDGGSGDTGAPAR